VPAAEPAAGTPGADLPEAQVAEWKSLYPSLDIPAEARKALAWLQANPGRQKTIGGMPRFLVQWFNRSTDSARPATVKPATPTASTVGMRRIVARP